LMTDLIIFAALFATFVVLRNNTYGGPTAADIFQMPFMLAETLLLLTSSFTCAIGMLAVHQSQRKQGIFWFILTFLLGCSFLTIEIYEFHSLIKEGANPQRSAFLSSYFTLVGTHGFHIFIGLLWMVVALVRIAIRPFVESSVSRILRMALFWHFLDFVWIFIFTTVYGMGYLLQTGQA
ncbi:MAG: cytochrome c oxidase subunit 3, partial [Chlamydiales bacterium]